MPDSDITLILKNVKDSDVLRVGAGETVSVLVGRGFRLDKEGFEHGLQLEAAILKADGSDIEANPKVIFIEQPKDTDITDREFPIKVTVFEDIPYNQHYKGLRKVVIKKKGENLQMGNCPADSPCSLLPDAITIKPALL